MDRRTQFSFFFYGFLSLLIQVGGDTSAPISVYETYGKGTIIFNETVTCNVTSLVPPQPETYVMFNDQNSLVIEKQLDLEVLKLQTANSTELTVLYTCGSSLHQSIVLNIIPVNEFNPIFLNSPYSSSIKEGRTTGSEILYLGNKWRDDDKVKFGTVSEFCLHGYTISAFDGFRLGFFNINKSTGNITTAKVFDYEQLLRKYLMLNVSIMDDGGRMSFTTVNVTIEDIDDNPPVFTSCGAGSKQCHVTAYTAIIDRHFLGNLLVSPTAISAKDLDTGINTKILYTIDGGDSENDTYVQINNFTGAVEIVVPFLNFTDWTETEMVTMTLQVTATEDSTNAHHTNISLAVLVYKELPTTPTLPPPTTTTKTTTTPKSSTSTTLGSSTEPEPQMDPILLVEIIVPVCGVAVLVIIAVCVIRNCKKKQRDSRYKLRESQRLEKVRKSENFENKNIDVLSSTPINPYDLISMYARIDSDKSGNNGGSKAHEADDTAELHDDKSENGEIYHSENGKTNKDMYTKVDKRKPRKRQKQALMFKNDAFDTKDPFDEAENNSKVGQYVNTTEANIEHNENEHEVEKDKDAGQYHTVTEEDVYENSPEPDDSSEQISGSYNRYSEVDLI